MDILPIQASAVPCERVFSSGKETMTARRSRISHTMMEALQILKFAIRHGHTLDFTQGLSMQDELRELEALQPQAPPEDINAFVHYLYHYVEEQLDYEGEGGDDDGESNAD